MSSDQDDHRSDGAEEDHGEEVLDQDNSQQRLGGQEHLDRWVKIFELIKEACISIVILAAIGSFGFVLYRELQREPIIVVPFDVPEELAKKGYTGAVLTNRFLDQLVANREGSYKKLPDDQKRLFPNLELLNLGLADAMDVQIPETSLSINLITQYIRRLRGTEVRISGEVVGDAKDMEITIRINGKTKSVRGKLNAVDKLLDELGYYVVEIVQPYFLALHYYTKKNHDKALELIKNMLVNEDKLDDTFAYDLWGNILVDQKEFLLAIEKFKESIRMNPKNDSPYIGLGYAYYEGFRDYDAAIAAYKIVTERNPKNYSAFNDFALVLMDQGDMKNAIANYRNAIAANPYYANAYYNLGLAFVGAGDYNQAIEEFTHMIDMPYHARNHFNAYNGLCYALGQQRRFEEALKNCEMAIAIRPNDDNIYDTLGGVYFSQKKYGQALEFYKKALELNENNSEAHQHLAETLSIRQECVEANKHLALALKLNKSASGALVQQHCAR